MNVRINWHRLLDDPALSVKFRACSVKDGWRPVGNHTTLRKALFEESGARELFREGSALHRKRSKSYGLPHFVAVWVDGEQWALLIKERVAAVVPAWKVEQFDGLTVAKRREDEQVAVLQEALQTIFDQAETHLSFEDSSFTGDAEIDMGKASIAEKRGARPDPSEGEESPDSKIQTNSEAEGIVSADEEDALRAYYEELEEGVARSLGDREARIRRLQSAEKSPSKMTLSTVVFRRNPDVIAETLERASGICERCGSKAPFVKASNGLLYLEVHHRIPLSEDGEDSIENAIALCPNCHREAHYGAEKS